jgi:hypothetical protein
MSVIPTIETLSRVHNPARPAVTPKIAYSVAER